MQMESLQNFSKELQKYIFKRSQSEANSVKLYKDVSVTNFSSHDVNEFSYDAYHSSAMDRYPILMASVTGAVCNQSYDEIHNPTRKGFGGSRSSEDISLKPVICQTVSRMLHNKHPRSVTSLQCMNSALNMVHHVPGRALVSSNALGDSFR